MKKTLLSLTLLSCFTYASANSPVVTEKEKIVLLNPISFKLVITKDNQFLKSFESAVLEKETQPFASYKSTSYIKGCSGNDPMICTSDTVKDGLFGQITINPQDNGFYKVDYNIEYSELLSMKDIAIGETKIQMPDLMGFKINQSVNMKHGSEIDLGSFMYYHSEPNLTSIKGGINSPKVSEYKMKLVLN